MTQYLYFLYIQVKPQVIVLNQFVLLFYCTMDFNSYNALSNTSSCCQLTLVQNGESSAWRRHTFTRPKI